MRSSREAKEETEGIEQEALETRGGEEVCKQKRKRRNHVAGKK